MANLDPEFGHWLAGFIDGEGCLQICKVSARNRAKDIYRIGFSISLRADDGKILEYCCKRTGLGKVRYYERKNSNTSRYAQWAIVKKSEVRELAELLKQYPLRAKKRRDFIIWEKALTESEKIERGGGTRIWTKNAIIRKNLAAFQLELQAARRENTPYG